MVTIRTYEDDDYPIVQEWWKKHGWDGVPQGILPPLGAIADCEDYDICAAWVYLTANQGICWIEWLVSNPDASPIMVRKGIKALMDYFDMTLHALNYNVIFTSCRQASLGRVFEAEGFTKTDDNVSHYIKVVKVEDKE